MSAKKIKRVNVAVVGLGFMGVTHLRSYLNNPRARVVAVCDATRLPENGVLRGVAGNIKKSGDIRLGTHVKVYRELAGLLADRDIELVDLCTPTALHAAQAIAALKADKHVLCEKPLAQNATDARTVLKAATAATTFLMPAMCMRFWPGWGWLKRIVAEKTYGTVRAASFRRLSAMPAWGGAGVHTGGALLDLHIHDTDFVNFLFGRPQGVFSTGVTGAGGVINHVVTQYHFPAGPAVCAEGSWLLASGFNMGFTLLCERAALDFDLSRGGGALRVDAAGKKSRTIKLAGGDGYDAEVRYFVDCVARGQRPEIVTARDALTALQICEAEEKSVRTGRLVKI
ncbi:MAG: Gfo/Idh/MocA family oxidoreductase [Verrucomicrobiota bacterium]